MCFLAFGDFKGSIPAGGTGVVEERLSLADNKGNRLLVLLSRDGRSVAQLERELELVSGEDTLTEGELVVFSYLLVVSSLVAAADLCSGWLFLSFCT